MAKKENVQLTSKGLQLLTVMCNASYFDGVYGKTVFFTNGFKGDRQYLFQATGYMGGITTRDVEDSIQVVIIGDHAMSEESFHHTEFIDKFEPLLNQNNSPYRRIRFITESHFIERMEKRCTDMKDDDMTSLLQKYKESTKTKQRDLFDFIDEEKK